jgi:tRNA/rRNA methyltransferase/tRNA (cytidine32/uridine32-2'-O)-methyltransferase
MKNMGLSRLTLALPERAPHAGDTQILSLEGAGREAIVSRAVHAADLWERARVRPGLKEAVEGCPLVIGVTRRRGRGRKRTSMTVRECAAFLKEHPGPAALVFGNERTGLDDSELALCGLASHIPADEAFPSLNLSHAVQLYAYEIYLALARPEPVKGQWVPLDKEGQADLVAEIAGKLKLLGFYRRQGREEQERFLRDLFARAALTAREAEYFRSVVNRAVHLALRGDGAVSGR